MILLQDPNIPVATNPVEIDAAIIDILSELIISYHGYLMDMVERIRTGMPEMEVYYFSQRAT